MASIIAIDQQLLLFFNGFHTLFFDHFFMIFSGKIAWIPLGLMMIFIIIRNKGKKSVWLLFTLILLLVCTDQISTLIKHAIERPRPTHEPALIGLVQPVFGYLGGNFGFVSSHASNSFAFALFTSLLFRNKYYGFSIFLWATTTVYSRLYLGVHYPGDILCGALLGLILAFIFWKILAKTNPSATDSTDFSYKSISVIVSGLLSTILVIAIIALFKTF